METYKQINEKQDGFVYDVAQLRKLAEENDQYVVVTCIKTKFESMAKDAVHIIEALEKSQMDYVKTIRLKVTISNSGDTFSVTPVRIPCKNALS